MVMIPAHNCMRMAADPVDAGDGIRCVVNDIAEEQAGIEAFVDRRECWPVGMDIGEKQDAHGLGVGEEAEASVRCGYGILREFRFRRYGF